MKSTQSESMILAIESAVGGGSISLLRGSTEIAGWIGEGGVSRAEDLLPNISRLLHKAVVDKYDITKLAVSTGPGS
jgi:tRNA threonylcarbamoyladenosine biosynthesis protein TsaB